MDCWNYVLDEFREHTDTASSVVAYRLLGMVGWRAGGGGSKVNLI